MTICNDCETVAHCLKHGCIPKVRSTEDMAKEAGLHRQQHNLMSNPIQYRYSYDGYEENLKAFEALVRADERNRTWTQEHWTEYERSIAAVEREACAKMCEQQSLLQLDERVMRGIDACAAVIRARGQA
jgi:hypothetical protein